MFRLASRIFASAAFFCSFLLLPSTSQATIEPDGLTLVAIDAGDVQSDAPICDTITTCTFQDPAPGQFDVAISFDMSQDATVHIEIDLYDGFSCQSLNVMGAGDLALTAGHHIVYLVDPLDPGTEVSAVWRLGTCAETPCTDYCIGNYPAICQ